MNENQQIITLLEKQNVLLENIERVIIHHEKVQKRQQIIHLIIQAIPYLALLAAILFFYFSLKHYLDALNHNLDVLRDGFINFEEAIKKFIPDFSGIKSGLDNAWQSTKSLFN
jgi:hypothetical protein